MCCMFLNAFPTPHVVTIAVVIQAREHLPGLLQELLWRGVELRF